MNYNSTLLFDAGNEKFVYNGNTRSIALFRNGSLVKEKEEYFEFDIKRYEGDKRTMNNRKKPVKQRNEAADRISKVNVRIQEYMLQ